MNRINTPNKEDVRRWLMQRQIDRKPLPDREKIRRELGWELVDTTREARPLVTG